MFRWKQMMSVLTIGSLAYFVLGTILAMILYPNYDFFGQFLSALGVSKWGFLFNSAVVSIGISTMFLYATIAHDLWLRPVRPSFFLFVALLFGSFSGILLIGVGIFVASGNTSDIHDLFAISFFLVLMLLTLFFVIGLVRSPLFKDGNTKIGLTLFGFTISLSIAVGLFVPKANQYVTQKLVVLLYLIFVFWLTRVFVFESLPKKIQTLESK